MEARRGVETASYQVEANNGNQGSAELVGARLAPTFIWESGFENIIHETELLSKE